MERMLEEMKLKKVLFCCGASAYQDSFFFARIIFVGAKMGEGGGGGGRKGRVGGCGFVARLGRLSVVVMVMVDLSLSFSTPSSRFVTTHSTNSPCYAHANILRAVPQRPK
jgi:hypothetical protein